MSYLHGTSVLCVGAASDSATDYDYGEKQVKQLVQFFEALGRPREFEAPIQAAYRSYEDATTTRLFQLYPNLTGAALKWNAATKMKQVGADASRLMAELQAAYPNKSASVPSGGSSAVYKPGVDDGTKSWLTVPWWAYPIGIGVLGLVGYKVFRVARP